MTSMTALYSDLISNLEAMTCLHNLLILIIYLLEFLLHVKMPHKSFGVCDLDII